MWLSTLSEKVLTIRPTQFQNGAIMHCMYMTLFVYTHSIDLYVSTDIVYQKVFVSKTVDSYQRHSHTCIFTYAQILLNILIIININESIVNIQSIFNRSDICVASSGYDARTCGTRTHSADVYFKLPLNQSDYPRKKSIVYLNATFVQ